MTTAIDFPAGNYRFLPSVFQYSAGAAAMPGYRIVRVTLRQPVPIAAGFKLIADRLKGEGIPLQHFCACELRSPGQFTDAGFRAFNEVYVETLREWQIMQDNDVNPVARSNVIPDVNGPPEPSFYAFSYVAPADGDHPPTVVISGGAEAQEGAGPYRERIVRYEETSDDAMREKALYVVGEMRRRLQGLGFDWADTTAVQAYSVRDFHHVMAEMSRQGVTQKGLTWHYARPPVIGLDYEMDCRVVLDERG